MGSAVAGQGNNHIFCLQALVALHDRELDALALDQNAVALAANRPEVHEDVVAAVTGDKAEALGGVEPLHRAGFAILVADLALRGAGVGGASAKIDRQAVRQSAAAVRAG